MDSTEISFLSGTSSFGMISDVEISFSLTDQTPMNPKSHGVETPLLCMIKKVPESSNHKLSHLFFTPHKLINGINNVESFNRMKCIFSSSIKTNLLFNRCNDIFSGSADGLSRFYWFRLHDGTC